MTDRVTLYLPAGMRERIAREAGADNVTRWVRELVISALDGTTGPRWRPLLGDTLAGRVVVVAPIDPGDFCRKAIEHFVVDAERQNAAVASRAQRRGACSHPETARGINGRCRACGERGLPSVQNPKVREARRKAAAGKAKR